MVRSLELLCLHLRMHSEDASGTPDDLVDNALQDASQPRPAYVQRRWVLNSSLSDRRIHHLLGYIGDASNLPGSAAGTMHIDQTTLRVNMMGESDGDVLELPVMCFGCFCCGREHG